MMRAWWASDGGEWQMLVFAHDKCEAKKVAFDNMPMTDVEWIYIRVWLADQKWMKLFEPNTECIDYYEGDYETWNDYWNAELEGA